MQNFLYPGEDPEAHAEKARNILGDLDRPVVVVGNGPSIRGIDRSKIDRDSIFFRCNWFFLEDAHYFGKNVGLYFWSVQQERMLKELKAAILRGDYSVSCFCSPLTKEREVNRDTVVSSEVFKPSFDHWSVIARTPVLARAMMSRPLPTQGMQMLATALALGYRHIQLVGIDFYRQHQDRYFYSIPDHVKGDLKVKDYTAGYEKDHEFAKDLSFLENCVRAFPGAKIYMEDPPSSLKYIFSKSKKITNGFSDLLPKFYSEPIPYKKRQKGQKTERVAYVTYADRNFRYGLAALANSISMVSDIPLLALVPRGQRDIGYQIENCFCLEVDDIPAPQHADGQERFLKTFNKLHVFSLQLDKIVFIDSDAIVLQPIDDLFDHDGFWAAPDWGIRAELETFNSGVFVCSPSPELGDSIRKSAERICSSDGGDQGLLNVIFKDAGILPKNYNVLKRVANHLPHLFDLETTKILHFVGPKPWHVGCDIEPSYIALEKLWFSYLPDSIQQELFISCKFEKIPDNRDDLEKAYDLLLSGKPGAANKVYEKGLEDHSEDIKYLMGAAITSFFQTHYGKARNYAEKVVMNSENNKTADLIRSNANMLNKWKDVKKLLKKIPIISKRVS